MATISVYDRLHVVWERSRKQTVKSVANMIQFNTLNYLFLAIFRLELNKQNVNLLVKQAACGSLRWSLGHTPFFLCCPNGTSNPSWVHMHVLILYLLRTSESLSIAVKILNIGIDVEINSAYLKLAFFIALSVQPGLTSWPFSIILRFIGCSSKCIL